MGWILDWIGLFFDYTFFIIILLFFPYHIHILNIHSPDPLFSSVGVSLSIIIGRTLYLPIQIGTNLTFASSNIYITEVGIYITTSTVHLSHSESVT